MRIERERKLERNDKHIEDKTRHLIKKSANQETCKKKRKKASKKASKKPKTRRVGRPRKGGALIAPGYSAGQ